MAADPGRAARLAEIAEHDARRDRLAAQHGMPERISNADALALARTALVPVEAGVTADDWIYASIYRDEAAADAWLASNLEHHGYPALARVPLPDGRVVGILDLRAEMEKALARLRDPAYRAALERDATLGGKLHDVHGGPGEDCWCGYAGHDPQAASARE